VSGPGTGQAEPEGAWWEGDPGSASAVTANLCPLQPPGTLRHVPRVRSNDAPPVAYRTARIRLRLTPGQARRCWAMLRAGGDVWAALIELNSYRFRHGARPLLNYQELCREVAGVRVGELSVPALRSVVRRYADACMETARRKRRGERARYPRRRRQLVPLRYYAGTFELRGRRLRLSTARGTPALWLLLARPIPYGDEAVRSVTLLSDAGRLVLDVSAEVPVAESQEGVTAGVDLGIIHPFAATSGSQALLVSGRVIRAEERLHLADTKARARATAKRAPRPAQRGSRRWRQARRRQRQAEARHLRRVRQMQHHAAKELISWAQAKGVGTLVVGDPRGIAARDAGRRQNRRVATTWRRTHLVGALRDKAEVAGIEVVLVDERGTSSTCPECTARVPKPKGRRFTCPFCGYEGHRDLVGARNIAARGGGTTTAPAVVTHRRAGAPPARRDRRRHLMDRHRSCPAPGRPARGESLAGRRTPTDGAGSTDHGRWRGSGNKANVALKGH